MAALATLLSAVYRYEDVQVEAARLARRWRSRGLAEAELQAVARALGVALVARPRRRLATACGVLVVHGPHFTRDGHYVAVCDGRVSDPGIGVSLPWRAYLGRYDAHVTSLLALAGGRRNLRRLAAAAAARALPVAA